MDRALTKYRSDIKAKLPMVFNDAILKTLKGIAPHPMMQVRQYNWFMYGRFKKRYMRDELRIFGRLLSELYKTIHVNNMEDFNTLKHLI